MIGLKPLLSSLLTNLGEICHARSLVLWAPLDDTLELVANWRLDRSLYDCFMRRWPEDASSLRAGRHATLEPDGRVVPLLDETGTLVAVFLYAGAFPDGGPRRLYLDDALATIATLAADPVATPVKPDPSMDFVPLDVEPEDEDDDVQTVERRGYADLLQRCGWDVTSAADVLGMTRQALYDRLEELRLKRPVDDRPLPRRKPARATR